MALPQGGILSSTLVFKSQSEATTKSILQIRANNYNSNACKAKNMEVIRTSLKS